MFSAILTIIKFPLFNCIDDYDNNPSKDLAQGTTNATLNNDLMQNFDYNTIEPSDLYQKKMPYINHNREIFTNSDMNFIDVFLLNKKPQTFFFETINTFKSRIESVRYSIINMLEIKKAHVFKFTKEDKCTSKNLLGFEIDSETKKCLNDEFIKINEILKVLGAVSVNRMSIQKLLEVIDTYIFEDLHCENLFLNRYKSSIIFPNILYNEFLDLNDIIHNLNIFINTYKELCESVGFINGRIHWLKTTAKYKCCENMYTPLVLINNIFFKWHVELNINTIASYIKGPNNICASFLKQMVIYSKKRI